MKHENGDVEHWRFGAFQNATSMDTFITQSKLTSANHLLTMSWPEAEMATLRHPERGDDPPNFV